MPKKTGKYIFTLHNINFEQIDEKYGIAIQSNIASSDIPKNTTKIEDLLTSNNNRDMVSFLDESKRQIKADVCMVDYSLNKNPQLIGLDCFWCDIEFPKGTIPIGCPIRYVPHQAIQTYYSEISKDKYTIKQFITNQRFQQIEEKKDRRIKIVSGDYFLSDGAFCSFNCCQAFIDDNKHNSMYNESTTLLLEIYNRMNPNQTITKINRAPHWRKRRRKGGQLSDDEYRSSFNKIEFVPHGFITDTEKYLPKFKAVGYIFEEKIRF